YSSNKTPKNFIHSAFPNGVSSTQSPLYITEIPAFCSWSYFGLFGCILCAMIASGAKSIAISKFTSYLSATSTISPLFIRLRTSDEETYCKWGNAMIDCILFNDAIDDICVVEVGIIRLTGICIMGNFFKLSGTVLMSLLSTY